MKFVKYAANTSITTPKIVRIIENHCLQSTLVLRVHNLMHGRCHAQKSRLKICPISCSQSCMTSCTCLLLPHTLVCTIISLKMRQICGKCSISKSLKTGNFMQMRTPGGQSPAGYSCSSSLFIIPVVWNAHVTQLMTMHVSASKAYN